MYSNTYFTIILIKHSFLLPLIFKKLFAAPVKLPSLLGSHSLFFNFIFIIYTMLDVPICPSSAHLLPALAPPPLRLSPHYCLCLEVMGHEHIFCN